MPKAKRIVSYRGWVNEKAIELLCGEIITRKLSRKKVSDSLFMLLEQLWEKPFIVLYISSLSIKKEPPKINRQPLFDFEFLI